MTYTTQLIANLSILYKDTSIRYTHYEHINTLRLTIPESMHLKEFANNFYTSLEGLPEIDHPKQMVKFWLCQEGTADFHWRMINPSEQDRINASAIGINAGHCVSFEEYLANKDYVNPYGKRL